MTDAFSETANDNPSPDTKAISLSDLAAKSGIDEDTLLQRLAGILARRAQKTKGSRDV